jgi:hypothetical protein
MDSSSEKQRATSNHVFRDKFCLTRSPNFKEARLQHRIRNSWIDFHEEKVKKKISCQIQLQTKLRHSVPRIEEKKGSDLYVRTYVKRLLKTPNQSRILPANYQIASTISRKNISTTTACRLTARIIRRKNISTTSSSTSSTTSASTAAC